MFGFIKEYNGEEYIEGKKYSFKDKHTDGFKIYDDIMKCITKEYYTEKKYDIYEVYSNSKIKYGFESMYVSDILIIKKLSDKDICELAGDNIRFDSKGRLIFLKVSDVIEHRIKYLKSGERIEKLIHKTRSGRNKNLWIWKFDKNNNEIYFQNPCKQRFYNKKKILSTRM